MLMRARTIGVEVGHPSQFSESQVSACRSRRRVRRPDHLRGRREGPAGYRLAHQAGQAGYHRECPEGRAIGRHVVAEPADPAAQAAAQYSQFW